MRILFNRYSLFPLTIILIISIIVAFRDYSIGVDTLNYVDNYIYNGSYEGFEPAFRAVIKFFNLLTTDPTLFFGFICFFITIFYYKTYEELDYNHKPYYTLILFSLLLFSSWYINANTNGIRQGMSLAVLYYAYVKYFFNKKYFKFTIFYIISISFHYSTFMVLPFLFLYLLSLKHIVLIWLCVGLLYILGFNEIIFYNVLNILGQSDIYFKVKNYAEGEIMYYGFHWSFFFYTIFFPLFSLFLSYLTKNKEFLPIPLLKFYMILNLPFFILGFANFSNRYAVVSWFLIPLLQLSIIKQMDFSKHSLKFISISLFCFGIIYFYLFRINILGNF